jgi:competence protein ComEC
LLGKKSALPDDLITALQITGLTHIVVASGYNLTILVRAGRRIFARISKYLAAMTGVTLVVGFVLMTGMSATMMRAGIVALLGLWAWYYGRKFHPVTLLGAAGALTLLIDPSYAWGDLGWLLSFAAFAGVMIIAPIVTSYFFGSEKVPFVGQLLIETISAQIATLPIMIVAFHQLSAIAPIANVLILPLIPLAMLGVLITGVGAWLIPSLAGVIGWPIETLLNIQLRIIDWCASLPGALLKPTWNWLVVCVYIVAVAGLVAYMKWRTGYKLRDASLVE